MRKFIFLSLAILSVMSFLITSFAFAGEKKLLNDKNVIVISEKGAFLGIYMEDLDDGLIEKFDYPKSSGVWITAILEDSPAEKAGMKDGDIIYTIDGSKVRNTAHLSKLISEKKPGEKVEIELYRVGEKMNFEVELAEQAKTYKTYNFDEFKDDPGFEIGKAPYLRGLYKGALACMSKGALGIITHEMNEDLAGYFGVKPDEGVLVLDVVEDSAAEKAGIKSGDVVVEVAGEKISETQDIHDAISDISDDDETIEVVVVRKGAREKIQVDVEEMSSYNSGIWISPLDSDYFKHFKVTIPFKEGSLDDEEVEGELKDTIDSLKKELEVLEKRLKKLEKEDQDI